MSKPKLPKPINYVDVDTIDKLKQKIEEVYVVKDPGIVKVMAASVIASRMKGDPVFLFIVGASSGGKTEFINMLNGLEFVKALDTLTANTFASGAKKTAGSGETSLLMKVQNGIITIKDFTTILDMNETARKEIMSQLRVIFDGSFSKSTGLGDDIVWRGKISMISAVTTVIHQRSSEYKSMGERFMNYEIEQPTEEEVQERMIKNAYDIGKKRQEVQDNFTEYIEYVLENMQDEEIIFEPEQAKIIKDIAKYSASARSGLEVNPRDPAQITFIPDKERSSRILGQLFAIARAFIAMRSSLPSEVAKREAMEAVGETIEKKPSKLTDDEMNVLIKIALCSIPRKRRQALNFLAEYKDGVTTAGVAIKLNYNTLVIKAVMYELNALGFCKRARKKLTDLWILDEEWRDIICQFEELKPIDEVLEATDDVEDYTEANENTEALWDDEF